MPLPLIAAIGLGVSAASSVAQAVSGASRANRAKKALENFQRQELRNVTEGMRVSTLGAELQTQEAQRRFATSVEALRSGGVRGLVGGLGTVEQQQQAQQQQIAAGLDVQQQQIEQMRIQDEANIRAMQEQRESSQIAGLGAEIAAGRQMVNAGITGFGQTALSAASIGMTNKAIDAELEMSRNSNLAGLMNMSAQAAPKPPMTTPPATGGPNLTGLMNTAGLATYTLQGLVQPQPQIVIPRKPIPRTP